MLGQAERSHAAGTQQERTTIELQPAKKAAASLRCTEQEMEHGRSGDDDTRRVDPVRVGSLPIRLKERAEQ